MVTHTFDNGSDTGVPDSETLCCDTTEETSTSCSTVQADVTDKHVLLSLVYSGTRRVDDETTTRKTLSDVIVGVTLKLKRDTRGEEGTEGLTSRSADIHVDGISRKTGFAITLADLVRECGTHGPVGVDNVALDPDWQTLLKSKLGLSDKLVVESCVQLVVLLADVVKSYTRAQAVSRGENEG